MAKIICLTENSARRGSHFSGEHGLSFLIETGQNVLLFDTGQTAPVYANPDIGRPRYSRKADRFRFIGSPLSVEALAQLSKDELQILSQPTLKRSVHAYDRHAS